MDEERARGLLSEERRHVEGLLREARANAADARASQGDTGDIADPAEPLTAEGTDDALVRQFEDRLAAIERAEQRLRDGSYGRSVRSGVPLSDERLEADPAAELTVEEAAAGT